MRRASTVILGVCGLWNLACTGGSGSSSSSGSSGASSGYVVDRNCHSDPGTVTLCDVQNESSPNHPTVNTTVTFPEPLTVVSQVFVISSSSTSTFKGFFVVDGAGGGFRGALVKGNATLVDPLNLTVGSKLNLSAKVTEWQGTGAGSETQLELVGGNVVGNPGSVPDPIALDLSVLATADGAEPFEGVLISLSNVHSVRLSNGCITSYGSFMLEGGPNVGDDLFSYPVGLGEQFTRITGFLRYTYDGLWELIPRDAGDVVSASGARTYTTVHVTDVQDPANIGNLPHCQPPGAGDPIRLENVVVTSGPRVATKDSSGRATLYYVFVQDPAQLDGNQQPLPYSGVKVVFGRSNINSSYPLPVRGSSSNPNADNPDTANPGDWPQAGDVVTVEGSAQEYFDDTQFGDVRSLQKSGTVLDDPPLVTTPLPKSLVSSEELSGLAAGRRGVTDCPGLETQGAGPDAEKWEGVLVKLENVTTTLACVPTVTNSTAAPACSTQDFGYMQVTGDVEIGNDFGFRLAEYCGNCTCEGPTRPGWDNRQMGKVYTSITGVVDYTFSVFRVSPRAEADVVAAP